MNGACEALRAWLDMLKSSSMIKKSIDTTLRAQFQISISRFDVLSALERGGPEGLRAGALSEKLMVTEGNTTQVTALLVRDGLVKRSNSREDGRVAIFKLTKKGERLFSRIAAENKQLIDDTFSGLSKSELQQFRKLLGKLKLPNGVSKTKRPIQKKDAA